MLLRGEQGKQSDAGIISGKVTMSRARDKPTTISVLRSYNATAKCQFFKL
jgi:hypothetical protein